MKRHALKVSIIREFGMMIIIWSLLVGCVKPTKTPTPKPTEVPDSYPPPTEAQPTSPGVYPAPVIQPTAESTREPKVTPYPASRDFATDKPEQKPTPRSQLEATDPTMVSLETGKPLLVEFFAFW